MANTNVYNIKKHVQGSTFKGVTFEIKLNDIPLDLTGAVIEMQLDSVISPYPTALTLSTVEGNEKIVILQPPTDGKFRVIPQIINIPLGLYNYDIKITTADDVIRKPINGKWQIVKSATYD